MRGEAGSLDEPRAVLSDTHVWEYRVDTGPNAAKARVRDTMAPGKPYRVDTGPNAAKARARDTMAPLNHENTNTYVPTGNSPQTKYS